MKEYNAQVIVVGGGVTGTGILRDLSMRGISACLFERGDLAQGTSSRFHGLLHSGARYVVNDPESAVECSRENTILQQIAPECIVNTGGWFVQKEEDDPIFLEKWLSGCAQANIAVREIPAGEAKRREPLLSKQVLRVFEVSDAVVDGFKLIWANAKSAYQYGGRYYTYHNVNRLLIEGKRVVGVVGENVITGEKFVAHAEILVNATGAWAGELLKPAGASLQVICNKGALLAFNQRIFRRVINRLRQPGDGDIFVPHETITILGTTSNTVIDPADNSPSVAEVNRLLALGDEVVPNLARFRVIRAFAGVRPLYGGDQGNGGPEDGRGVSRNFALIDHEALGEVNGLLSVVGGKFTTYRLMAERAGDWVSRKLGNSVPSRTAIESLSTATVTLPESTVKLLPHPAAEKLIYRQGEQAGTILAEIKRDPQQAQLLCECEMVTMAEVKAVIADPDSHHLADVRRKTRLGMGTCQGAFCTYRAIPLLWEKGRSYKSLRGELKEFLDQRWKGIRPVLYGSQIRETELARAVYNCVLNLNAEEEE
ncbi:MAG TPA: anaerobic glycerol-3-phosphate dehydrogenase subunit GlpA [Desulfobacteria bacterium]|nr:anaerobic glycerol-3-phosphate dehydrogenase subunit GlpA [Desulfobacteria bacterium]